MSREQAIAELQALGVPIVRGGDVAQLKREIIRDSRPQTLRRFDPRHQCFSKMRHASEDGARRAAKRMGKPGLASYECVHCGKWHVGNAPRARGEIR